ncbi:MAG: PHP domain-containing protein, partial [Lachnospiraceae bacterium]|nr:PHP domain-containing protein [Lachnospiraceae bacterium]
MSKKFFEVFTDLSLKDECRDVFSEVWIDQMDLKMEDPQILLIRMHCDNLILRPDILYCEREIQRQVLDDKTRVHFVEHYDLSAQYTLSNLLEVYKDSLLDECFVLMPAVAVHLKNATWEAQDYTLTLTTCKSEVIENKLECLIKNLKKLFLERFSMEVNVQVHMDEQVKLRSENMPARHYEEEFLEYDARGAEFEMDAEGMPYVASSEDEPQVNMNDLNVIDRPEEYIRVLQSLQPEDPEEAPKDPEVKKAGNENGKNTAPKEEKKESGAQKSADAQKTAAAQKPASGGRWSRNARSGGKDGKSFQGPRRFRGVEGLRDTNDENSIYGQSFKPPETFTPINTLYSDVGEVFLYGQVFGMDSREISNGTKNIVSFCITDFTDSIRCKMFIATEDMPEFKTLLKDGMFVELWGICQYDSYDRDYEIASVRGIRKSSDKRTKRVDDAPVKRIELHCHTKMSEMDGVSDAGALVKQAVKWGHPALAITDHGVVHAFPDAMHALEKGSDFKVIYGVEAYLVDDHKHTVNDSRGQSLTDTTFIVFDIETTGFSPLYNDIIEIGAVKIRNNEVIDRFSEFINPLKPIPYRIEKLTSINDAMV